MGFGLTTLDTMEVNSPSALASLTAFDAGGNTVDAHSRAGDQGDSGLDLLWSVSSTTANITKVVFDYNFNTGFGMDDFKVEVPVASVPTPASAGIGFGLLGALGAVRRLRRRRTA